MFSIDHNLKKKLITRVITKLFKTFQNKSNVFSNMREKSKPRILLSHDRAHLIASHLRDLNHDVDIVTHNRLHTTVIRRHRDHTHHLRNKQAHSDNPSHNNGINYDAIIVEPYRREFSHDPTGNPTIEFMRRVKTLEIPVLVVSQQDAKTLNDLYGITEGTHYDLHLRDRHSIKNDLAPAIRHLIYQNREKRAQVRQQNYLRRT